MTTPNFSTSSRNGTASPAPGPDSGRPANANADVDWVSRDDYDRAIAEERGRRAGLEKAKQKAEAKLQKDVDDLKAQLQRLSAPQVRQLPPEIERIPEHDPLRPVVEALYENQRAYGEAYNSRVAEESNRREQERVDAAVREANLPDEWLAEWLEENEEDLTLRALRRAQREYKQEQTINDLRGRLEGANREAETVATRTREELGANKPFTGTGRQPIGRTIDDQLAEVAEVMEDLKKPDPRTPQNMRMIQLSRARAIERRLQDWKAAGNRSKHPDYD